MSGNGFKCLQRSPQKWKYEGTCVCVCRCENRMRKLEPERTRADDWSEGEASPPPPSDSYSVERFLCFPLGWNSRHQIQHRGKQTSTDLATKDWAHACLLIHPGHSSPGLDLCVRLHLSSFPGRHFASSPEGFFRSQRCGHCPISQHHQISDDICWYQRSTPCLNACVSVINILTL